MVRNSAYESDHSPVLYPVVSFMEVLESGSCLLKCLPCGHPHPGPQGFTVAYLLRPIPTKFTLPVTNYLIVISLFCSDPAFLPFTFLNPICPLKISSGRLWSSKPALLFYPTQVVLFLFIICTTHFIICVCPVFSFFPVQFSPFRQIPC